MTREEIIADLKEKNPVMKSGNDTDGYVIFTEEEYEAKIQEWADYVEQEQANKLKEEDEAEAKAAQKAALLERLGITEDEAKLLSA